MANYWIKAYIEILDDPKMATLPDRLWRRVMELFLLAGKFYGDGQLPETKQLAWVLRMTTDDLDLDLKQIERTGIVRQNNGGWFVVNFSKRQAATPGAERKRQYTQRQRSNQYYGNETLPKTERNVTQINRLTDNRLTETETETETDSVPAPTTPSKSILNVICNASGLSAIPPKEYERIEQVHSLIDVHGADVVEGALRNAVQRWVNTTNKAGRKYPVTNMGWVDWAQQELDTQEAPINITREIWESWNMTQKHEYLEKGGAIPDVRD